MSTATAASIRERLTDAVGFRGLALAGVALLTGSYLSVLYHVTDVVGGTEVFVLLVAGTVLLSTALGRFLRPRSAVIFTVVLVGGGTATYFLAIPQSQLALLSPERLLSDSVALLTGLSVLRLTAADVWSLAIAPGPVFLSWYLALRGRYAGSVAVGGATLGLFVLTGDAGTVTTLVGVVGAGAAVGLGTLETYGGTTAQFDTLVAVLAAMVVLAATLSVVPGGAAQPLLPDRGSATMEASLVETQDRVRILGSIRLSPSVRYTIESNEGHYWQTAVYDRYTSNGWVRSGDNDPYAGRLRGPPGAARSVTQTVTVESSATALPAAWKPVELSGTVTRTAQVTPQGTLVAGGRLPVGDTYTVESRVPQYTSEQLRRTGTDYPAPVREYLQLPDSTSPRVRERAAEIAGGEDNPYDKAVAIERWLEENKRYSLSVEKPEGDVAESFLFEMDAGYCTYYATTMAVLLRSQGVPARFAVGYTPGEEVSEGKRVVRGLDAHAWVEVYFEGVGWVRFDPTPAGPRQTAERTRLTEARQNGEPGVDTNETRPNESQPNTTPFVPVNETNGANISPNDRLRENLEGTSQSTNGSDVPAGIDPGVGDSGGGGGISLPTLPDRETLALLGVAVVGATAGARRAGLTAWLCRGILLRRQRRRDPETDVERAFRRVETLLERRYRPRRAGETRRAFLTALSRAHPIDDRVHRLADVYERARYGDGVTRAEADAVVADVDALVWEATPVVGELVARRIGRRGGGERIDAA